MANSNDGDDHAKLVELQGLLQRAQEVEQSLQQQIVRAGAKPKTASRNPADYARSEHGTMALRWLETMVERCQMLRRGCMMLWMMCDAGSRDEPYDTGSSEDE